MNLENIYHTDERPRDLYGQKLKPLDLVLIEKIPATYWEEEGCEKIKLFEGCYGIINYWTAEKTHSPFYNGLKGNLAWISKDATWVNVATRRHDAEEECFFSYDFWLPAKELSKIPYNSLIMNLFVEYPWDMQEVDGPSSELFIRKGIPEYEYLKKISETPYKDLVTAHNAAMSGLGQTLPYPDFKVV